MIKTIITFAKQRAKAYKSEFPVLSYTLSEFINLLHEKHSIKREISFVESVYILDSIIKNTELKHFDYLKKDNDTIKQMADFFIKLKKNDVDIACFNYPEAKKNDLEILFKEYNDFLEKNNLSDSADIEAEVIEIISNKNFSDILLDNFSFEKIKFISSKKQEQIYNILKQKAEPLKIEIKDYKADQSKIEAFNNFDEIKCAFKKVRDLLSNGVRVEDIKIVTSDIAEYQPIFEALLDEYGLKGYTSTGVALKNLVPLLNEKSDNLLLKQAKKIYSSLKAESENISKKLEKYNIPKTSQEILKDLIEGISIKNPDRTGIELLETNQIFGYLHIPHIIFIGADIEHFPPKKDNGIFYTSKQEEELFYSNSLYDSSYSIYQYMKKISENLYIIYSKYKQKTPLSISFIIDKNIKEEKLQTKADCELIKEKKRVEFENIENYLKALEKKEESEYDGKNVGEFEVKHLSASRLNTYIKCPRKYFFTYILRITPPESVEDEIEATTKGSIMHRCFEKFAKALKNDEISLSDNLEDKMYKIAKESYEEILENEELSENIYYKIFFEQLTKGLKDNSEKSGILKNFIEYVRDFKLDFKNSEMEKEFFLDDKLKITTDDKEYFIKGFIDRIDVKDDLIEIFDYKLKKVSGRDTKKLDEIDNQEDIQLGLYLYYAQKEHPDKDVKASLISFNIPEDKDKIYTEFATLANFEVPKPKNLRGQHFIEYNDEYEKGLIKNIYKVKKGISEGDFTWKADDEDYCNWCEYSLMCKKVKKVQENGEKN